MTDQQRKESGATWQAYNAMEATKHRHFDFLNYLERKKKNFNLDPTDEDNQVLGQLLKDHDEQVKLFTHQSLQLKKENPETHLALFLYIGKINELVESSPETH